MLALAPSTAIYLCTGATDMRKGFDGLLQIVTSRAERDVLDGGLFVFINRKQDRMKLLWWDQDGLAFFYKRLEKGTFQTPRVEGDAKSIVLSPTDLSLILGGIDLASARRRKRYRRSA